MEDLHVIQMFDDFHSCWTIKFGWYQEIAFIVLTRGYWQLNS